LGELSATVETLIHLRRARWATVPTSPGVYWWFFPEECLQRFRIPDFCPLGNLRLRRSQAGNVCLYHGMATNLADRVKWHAAQKLAVSALRSGFLSTLRLTLLALNDFDYLAGENEIDAFMDVLEIEWAPFAAVADAAAAEAQELLVGPNYPLNIQGNRRPELANYTRYLKSVRKAYRAKYLAR
jgi:GIY-YIG catalytic domain-containing protein